jgi:hypothetical protein
MFRTICVKIVKVTALVICVGIGASACWGHDGYGRDGHYGRDDHHDDHHEEHR